MSEVLEVLFSLWMYDIEVLTTPWVYLWVVPAILYSIFMFFKWAFLLMPIYMILSCLKPIITIKK